MFIAIVPAYNEEKNIASVVNQLRGEVDRVVVVDDGSSDDTCRVAREAGAVVLRHKFNRGQGAALETGHEYARRNKAEFVLHFDGDGQFDVHDIIPAKEHLENTQSEILFGSRFLHNDIQSQIPWTKRKILLPFARKVDRLMGSVSLTDSHNGFRIFTKKALDKIRLTQDKMAHASEIPQMVKKHNLKYVEYPVKVSYIEYGQRATKGVAIVKDLIFDKFI